MLARIALAVSLLFGGWQAAVADVVRVADGDCAGLSGAVNAASASSSPLTMVLLARNGSYAACHFEMSAGNVVIDGQGARISSLSACVGRPSGSLAVPYLVTPNAALTLRNLTIGSAASLSGMDLCVAGDGAGTFGNWPTYVSIFNAGNLTLDSISVAELPQLSFAYDGWLVSTGTLVLRNVTVANVNLITDYNNNANGSIIVSQGALEVYNSTFVNNRAVSRDVGVATYVISAAQAVIGNSLFAGNAIPSCGAKIVSLGGNVATDESCGFSAASGDKIVQSASLGTLGNNGGLVPTQAINGGGPAQGAGIAKYCEALDARGYTRAPNACDAGAYEAGGGSGALTANGMNGVYYDPAANGHYVTLQRVHDNGDIVVVWNTFDSKGNQAWVYGVGQLSGKRIHVAASQNIGGILQLGGAPTGSTVRSWGTLDVDLNTCASAQLSYASTLDGFGSGTFPLTRLTVTQDFGCRD